MNHNVVSMTSWLASLSKSLDRVLSCRVVFLAHRVHRVHRVQLFLPDQQMMVFKVELVSI